MMAMAVQEWQFWKTKEANAYEKPKVNFDVQKKSIKLQKQGQTIELYDMFHPCFPGLNDGSS